jgi:hypothetical protein
VKPVDFCRLELQSGTDADSRGRAALSWELLESKATNDDDLKPEKRAVSDLETFSNPYTDSRNLHSSPEQNVNMVFAGIDVEMPERFLADRLKEKGASVDAVCAHLLFLVGMPVFILVFRGLSGLG